MDNTINFNEILDRAIKDISKRVAKLDITDADITPISVEDSSSLVSTTNGDYIITIVLHTGDNVLRAITENMKRGSCDDESDITTYTTEYFNILCGHIVSTMNNKAHKKARFSVPLLVKGEYKEDISADDRQQLFFSSIHGPLKLETLYKKYS